VFFRQFILILSIIIAPVISYSRDFNASRLCNLLDLLSSRVCQQQTCCVHLILLIGAAEGELTQGLKYSNGILPRKRGGLRSIGD
jgi:hypothetical protein